MYAYEPILEGLTQRVWASYDRQVMDESRPEHGAFISESMPHPVANHGNHTQELARACYVFLAEGSSLEGDRTLFDRICGGIGFQKRWQRPNGLIDNVVGNWASPTATAFTVQLLAPIVEVARTKAEAGDERAAQIAESLGEYILSGAQGVIGGGFHTPNHRWVVCSGLAQAMSLFPDLQALDYVESILAETVDINEDGEYIERSTGVYNAVCNRSLRLMADHLKRPELLDPVRENLDMMAHLFHADGTVVTDMSNRQDRGQRVVPVGSADSFFDMAQRDGNGMWAAVADRLVAAGFDAIHQAWLIHPFMVHPAYCHDTLKRKPLPDDFGRVFPAARLWRVKRGLLSATALGGNATAFAMRYGAVNLKALKVFGSYYGTQFEADTFEASENGVQMVRRGDMRRSPGYDMPLGRPVRFDAFHAIRDTRERWTLPPFDVALDIREVEGGFDFHLKTEGGIDRVTFWIACCFGGPGEWENDGQVIRVTHGLTAILKSGYGVFHRGNHAVRIGPGAAEHRMWGVKDAVQDADAFQVLLTLQTPIDRVFEIRCGKWSIATGEMLRD